MDSRRSAEELADIESSGNKSELSISRGEESISQAQDRLEPQSEIKSRGPKALEKIASRITTRSNQDPGPPPDGGIVAWTQIACAWLAITNSWGFVNSFGAFQPYYETILPESASTISWIGSIQAGLLFIVGVFSGRALDYGWFRPTVALGIAVQLLGIFAMSASSSYWQLLLTQGVCTGIGGGIFFLPMMGVCSTYFAKNRGIAIGIVTTGNSIGGVVYPLVVRQLLGKVGFGWTVRVLGFINVVCLLVAFAFMKPRLPPRKAGNIIDMDAIRDLPYCLHVLGICFLMPPVYCVFYYVASFARDTLGMPYTTSLNMVIIVNGVGLPARILPGWIADRYLGVLNVLIICVLCNIIVLWSWLAVDSIPAYYVWTVCYGLVGAAFQSLFTPAVATYSPDITKTGTRLGMAFCTIGGAALVGGPISGALLISADGNYKIPIAWASASTVAGWMMITAARCLKFGWKVFVRC